MSIPKFANCSGPRGCGITFRTFGNRGGHCSGCHRCFLGIEAFDRHQTISGGRVTCHDPAGVRDESDPDREVFAAREEDGVTFWTLVPTPAQAARWATLAAERSTLRQNAAEDGAWSVTPSDDDGEAA